MIVFVGTKEFVCIVTGRHRGTEGEWYARHVVERYQAYHPEELELVAWSRGGPQTMLALRAHLNLYHLRGGWYRRDAVPIKALLEQVVDDGRLPSEVLGRMEHKWKMENAGSGRRDFDKEF